MTTYIAIVHKEPDSDYGVSFPDFPGCVTAGHDLDDARAMAQEALEAHTDFMQKEGRELPSPSTMEEAVRASMPEGLFATMAVSLEREKSRVLRINITVPARDLARIDRYAASHGLSRSAFMVQAARKAIHRA
jgi:predicted RNase H-like HicB family nuclease